MSKEAMKLALEALEWIASQLRAALAERPEREPDKSSVCEDIQQLCINGDLPWQFEDVIDWITKGKIPAQSPRHKGEHMSKEEMKRITRDDTEHGVEYYRADEVDALLAQQPAQQEPVKLWLWKNFVNGKPEYWAFNNPFPCLTVNGDPLTFGEPCGWAIFKPSVNGRPERSEQEVINTVTRLAVTFPPQRKPLTDDEIQECWYKTQGDAELFARAIEAAHGIKENT